MNHAQSRLSPTQYAYYLRRMPGNDLGKVGPEQPWPVLEVGSHLLEIRAISPVREISHAHIPFEVVAPVQPEWVVPPLPGEAGRVRLGGGGGESGKLFEVR